jgi:WD40 repeat protein
MDAPLDDRSAPEAGRRVRLAIWGWAQVGLVAVLAGAVVVLTAEPTPPKDGSPAWSTFTGHMNGVRAVAFSRDGWGLATGGIDGAVVIWQMRLGAQRVLSSDSGRPVICLAFAPDGETLAAGDHDSTLTVWSTAKGVSRFKRRVSDGQVQCLAFSPDGCTLATGSGDGNIRLWDVASGEVRATPIRHASPVCAICYASKAPCLAAGYADGEVWLWDIAGGQPQVRLRRPGHSWAVQCLAFSPDGSTMVSGGALDGARIWDVSTGRKREVAAEVDSFIKAAAFAPDGRTLLVVRQGGLIQQCDVATGRELARTKIGSDNIRVAFCADGRFVASAGADAILRVWDLAPTLAAEAGNDSKKERPDR